MLAANYLTISTLISLVSIIYTDYLYGELDGEFVNGFTTEIDVEVFYTSWVSLYMVDTSGNKLAITSGTVRRIDNIHFIGNFNGRQFFFTSVVRHSYLTRWFKMHFSITNNSLYYQEESFDSSKLLLSNIFISSHTPPGAFSGFPAARNFTKEEHKMFVWTGTIGPIIDHTKYGRTNISSGCIRKWRVNHNSVEWVSNPGEYFLYPCKTWSSQKICSRGHCQNSLIKTSESKKLIKSKKFRKPFRHYEEFLDDEQYRNRKLYNPIYYEIVSCHIHLMNTKKYCWEDLSSNGQQIRSYSVRERKTKSAIILLAWSQQNLRNNCLMEILGRKRFIIFRTSNNSNVMMCYGGYGSMNCTGTLWQNISLNKIYVLLIEWKDTNMIVKMSNGDHINIFMDEITVYPYLINIGFSSHTTDCDTFQGSLAFRDDTYELKYLSSFINPITSPNPFRDDNYELKYLSSSTNSISSPRNVEIFIWPIILSWTLLISSMVLVFIICFSVRINRRMKKTTIPILNPYEEQVQLTNIPPLTFDQSQDYTYQFLP